MKVKTKITDQIFKDETKKEFVCRQCGRFLNAEELIDGKCPKCDTDDDVFLNDLNEVI
jgi:rubrerythrin